MTVPCSSVHEYMNESALQTIQEQLLRHRECIRSSKLHELVETRLRPFRIRHIRCLALGSPTSVFQPLHQLALLDVLREDLGMPRTAVSVYDPAFTPLDRILLQEHCGYTVEEDCFWDSSFTLYYMPHASRSMTETLLNDKKPILMLGNDLSVTIGTLNLAKFLESYPTLATIVHLVEKKLPVATSDEKFTQVKCRRKRRPKKLVYASPELVYDTEGMYFTDVEIQRIASPKNAPWRDSFSDLAFNRLFVRDPTSAAAKEAATAEKSPKEAAAAEMSPKEAANEPR